jgi:hypothetical protein
MLIPFSGSGLRLQRAGPLAHGVDSIERASEAPSAMDGER